MARITLSLTLDSAIAVDAVGELQAIVQALASRHGQPFRDLDRRIERFLDTGPGPADVDVQDLGEGQFVAFASGELAAILKAARQLGL